MSSTGWSSGGQGSSAGRRAALVAALVAALLPACVWISKGDLDERLDLDADGVPRPDDCDDDDPAVTTPLWFVDADVDGYGDASLPREASCVQRIGLSSESGDCNDQNGAIFPGSAERCNGEDDDCNGVIDDDPTDLPRWYYDSDGDGFGDPGQGVDGCEPFEGFVANGDDCDDLDPNRGGPRRWFRDNDGDDFGSGLFSEDYTCAPPPGAAARIGDCDDADPTIYPGATERCDAADVDEDCDGLIDDDDPGVEGLLTWYLDADGDGFGDPREVVLACDLSETTADNDDDCDDGDPLVGAGGCPPVDIGAGGSASCALLSDGRVRCWGSGPVVDSAPADRRFSAVSVGDDHACGIDLLGTLSCWGEVSEAAPAVAVPVRAIDLEGDRTCATTQPLGALTCWTGGEEQLLRVSGAPFAAALAGAEHGCGLLSDGLRCLGGCAGPECDRVDGFFGVAAAGDGFTCAASQELGLDCWGDVSAALDGLADVEGLSVYGRQVCVLDPMGEGQCFDADDGAPISMPAGPWLRLAAGAAHGCGLGVDGVVRCWGSDLSGAASPPF